MEEAPQRMVVVVAAAAHKVQYAKMVEEGAKRRHSEIMGKKKKKNLVLQIPCNLGKGKKNPQKLLNPKNNASDRVDNKSNTDSCVM